MQIARTIIKLEHVASYPSDQLVFIDSGVPRRLRSGKEGVGAADNHTNNDAIMNEIRDKLSGPDRRSIGQSDQVVAQILAEPNQFGPVFDGMLSNDPVMRMRCADVIEKVTQQHPEYLIPYKDRLIYVISQIDQHEVRWHVAQMFPRLFLTPDERRLVVKILSSYLEDQSKIVKTLSMQALADIAEQDAALRPAILK